LVSVHVYNLITNVLHSLCYTTCAKCLFRVDAFLIWLNFFLHHRVAQLDLRSLTQADPAQLKLFGSLTVRQVKLKYFANSFMPSGWGSFKLKMLSLLQGG